MKSYNCNSEWFEKGIDYALKSWTSTFNRMGKPNPYYRIEKIMLGIIAENAVIKYFEDNNITYNEIGKTRWYEIDRFDIGVGDYVIDVKANFLNLNYSHIKDCFNNLLQTKEEWLQDCFALVPLDQFNPESTRNKKEKKEKIYIFPFIEGVFNESAGNDTLIHAFWDYKWLKKAAYKDLKSLGKLELKYEGTLSRTRILLYGTSEPKKIIKEAILLDRHDIITKNKFHQIFAIRVIEGKIDGDLTVNSPSIKKIERIKNRNDFLLEKGPDGKYYPTENNWQNLKLHQGVVYILGWISETDIRIIGRKIPRFSKNIPQYSETKVDNWGCIIKDLKDMAKFNI